MSVEEIKKQASEKMEKCVSQMRKEMASIRTGRANPLILDKVVVDYYGAPTGLRQLAQVTVAEGTTLVITPFDKTIIKDIEKAIVKAEIGITPNSDGVVIRLAFPPLTQDRRKELVRQVKEIAEEGKIALRNIRQDANTNLKNLKLPEDDEKRGNERVQDLINKYNKIIEEKLKEKEAELMTI